MEYAHFNPDLIVEVTVVCDKSCPGCYAANVLSHDSPTDLHTAEPWLFLSPAHLSVALAGIATPSDLTSIALRGGEPTRHPELPQLLATARATHKAASIYLETHGRWLLSEGAERLTASCSSNAVIVKLSYDSMHGMTELELKSAVNRLTAEKLDYLIAITEPTEAAFNVSRAKCDFIPNSRIIFQRKATDAGSLVRPRLGIIDVTGTMQHRLTTKASFYRAKPSARPSR